MVSLWVCDRVSFCTCTKQLLSTPHSTPDPQFKEHPTRMYSSGYKPVQTSGLAAVLSVPCLRRTSAAACRRLFVVVLSRPPCVSESSTNPAAFLFYRRERGSSFLYHFPASSKYDSDLPLPCYVAQEQVLLGRGHGAVVFRGATTVRRQGVPECVRFLRAQRPRRGEPANPVDVRCNDFTTYILG